MIAVTTEKEQTPSSNTGLKCQNQGLTTKIDFLQVVFDFYEVSEFQDCVDYLASCFKDEVVIKHDTPAVHGQRYCASGYSPRGMAVAYNHRDDERGVMGQAWVSLPGAVLAQLPVPVARKYFKYASDLWGLRATRIDAALDDYDKSITPEILEGALNDNNYSGFEDWKPDIPRKRGVSKDAMGWTYYLGSRKSDKIVRFYNKEVESGGEINAYRWEAQFRAKKAEQIFKEYIEIEDDDTLGLYISALVTGAVDFVDRSSGDRLSRQKRLGFWQEFIDKIGGSIKVSVSLPKPSLERTLNWMSRQVQTSLSLLSKVFGEDGFQRWIGYQLQDGERRLKNHHFAKVRVAKLDAVYV